MEKRSPYAKKLWSNYKILKEVKKNDRTKFVIALGCNDGFRCVIVREWYLAVRSGEWKPGRDGINIPLISPCAFLGPDDKVTHATIECLLPFIEALKEAAEELPTMALADPEHELWYEPKPTQSN